MTDTDGGLLTPDERTHLAADELDAQAHRSLDEAVGYRVRLLAAQPDRIDPARIEADIAMLADHGHNATVSLARARLEEHL